MSFILDALRKSETERQRQSGPGLVDAGYRPPAKRQGIWLPLLVIVLVINAVLLGIFWQRSPEPPATAAVVAPQTSRVASAPGTPPLVSAPEDAQASPPPVGRSAASADAGVDEAYASTADLPALEPEPFTEVLVPPPAPEPAAPGLAEPPAPQQAPQQVITEGLPSADQLIASGALSGQVMHLDIHVYSTDPAERFVFINMRKYTEGMKLPDGPVLEEITPDGAVFTHNGQRFLLARD